MFENTVFGRLDQKLQHAISDAGCEMPTPIQEKAFRLPTFTSRAPLSVCPQTWTDITLWKPEILP